MKTENEEKVPTCAELLARVAPVPSSSGNIEIEPKATDLSRPPVAPGNFNMTGAEKDKARAEAANTVFGKKS